MKIKSKIPSWVVSPKTSYVLCCFCTREVICVYSMEEITDEGLTTTLVPLDREELCCDSCWNVLCLGIPVYPRDKDRGIFARGVRVVAAAESPWWDDGARGEVSYVKEDGTIRVVFDKDTSFDYSAIYYPFILEKDYDRRAKT